MSRGLYAAMCSKTARTSLDAARLLNSSGLYAVVGCGLRSSSRSSSDECSLWTHVDVVRSGRVRQRHTPVELAVGLGRAERVFRRARLLRRLRLLPPKCRGRRSRCGCTTAPHRTATARGRRRRALRLLRLLLRRPCRVMAQVVVVRVTRARLLHGRHGRRIAQVCATRMSKGRDGCPQAPTDGRRSPLASPGHGGHARRALATEHRVLARVADLHCLVEVLVGHQLRLRYPHARA
jgi:hypothetical protein